MDDSYPVGHVRHIFPVGPHDLQWLGQRSEGVLMAHADGRPRFMTVAEVAQFMRVSTMTVYRLIKAGDLAAVRVGKSYRIREDDVDQYLSSRYTQAG